MSGLPLTIFADFPPIEFFFGFENFEIVVIIKSVTADKHLRVLVIMRDATPKIDMCQASVSYKLRSTCHMSQNTTTMFRTVVENSHLKFWHSVLSVENSL